VNESRRQLPVGALLAGAGGVVLVVSLFLHWYGDVTAFTIFEFNDLLLLLLGAAAIAAVAAEYVPRAPAVSSRVLLAVALLALFVVVSQLLNDPPAAVGREFGHSIGIWLALAGSALMVIGALLAYADISLAVEARPRQPRDGP
jgi:hypothetical protein